jgi:ABC-type sugar transport system permease subunit
VVVAVERQRGQPGEFVGLKNFIKAWNDSIFRTAFYNTTFYTFWATIFKLALGMWLALLLNRSFRGKRIVRASMLLPFIVPTVLSTFAWRWMFDPTFSVLNWLLYQGGFITTKLPFLSDGTYGMWCAIVVNTWRGMPFFAITLLAGLQTISPDLQEAASLDGANGWHRFWHVTWPLLKPVTVVVVVFSIIQTFSDFQLIYVLTGGGPANATHLLAPTPTRSASPRDCWARARPSRSSCSPCSSSWCGCSCAISAASKALRPGPMSFARSIQPSPRGRAAQLEQPCSQSAAVLNVQTSTPRTAASFGPRLARSSPWPP